MDRKHLQPHHEITTSTKHRHPTSWGMVGLKYFQAWVCNSLPFINVFIPACLPLTEHFFWISDTSGPECNPNSSELAECGTEAQARTVSWRSSFLVPRNQRWWSLKTGRVGLCQNAKAKPLNPLNTSSKSLSLSPGLSSLQLQVFTTPGHFNKFWPEGIPHDFLTYQVVRLWSQELCPCGHRSFLLTPALNRWFLSWQEEAVGQLSPLHVCQVLRPWKREPFTKMDSLKYALGPFFRKVENYHQPNLVQFCRLEHDVRKRTTHGEM